jgi:alkyldihydroxyacetonephosphate synthase
MSQAIKEASTGIVHDAKEWLKKFFLQKIKGFDLEKMAACTIKFEGTKEEVDRQRRIINELVNKHLGIMGGSENG